MTYTNDEVHKIIEKNLSRSAMSIVAILKVWAQDIVHPLKTKLLNLKTNLDIKFF